MQALSISFGVGLDNKGRLIRSITLEVVAELDPADASQETLSGRLLYLLPFQLREIKESGNAIVSFKGQEYWFVRSSDWKEMAFLHCSRFEGQLIV